jgi:hypothetical protein
LAPTQPGFCPLAARCPVEGLCDNNVIRKSSGIYESVQNMKPAGDTSPHMKLSTRVNLHCHSTFSDGELTPEALADRLASAGVI